MEKTIKITIEIESELDRNTTSVIKINDMLFTNYSNLLDADDILESFKKAMKVSKNFKDITICVNTTDYGNYLSYQHIQSFRILNNYGIITASEGNLTHGNFVNYLPFDIKHINQVIKDHVRRVNSQFIIEVKKKQALA
tara:strand:+ start:660 stop:1076 length:417 start_codon:yes stop_codon:yes gene_type:complete